jgi:hypothetical protein
MNTAFVNIIKRIIAEQGESILANPQQLKGFVADYAKNEPKEDRLAFGRCIEAGAYAQLKNTRTEAERRQVKAALLPRIRQTSGLGAAQCSAALDALEAALFGIPQSVSQPQYQSPPRYQHSQSSRQAYQPTVAARQMPATAPAQYQNRAYRQPSAPYGTAQTATARKKKRAGIFVLAAALILVIIVVSLTYLRSGEAPYLNAWKGYADFESFRRASNLDEFFGEPITEEGFLGLMGLAALGSLFDEDIEFDIVSGKKLTTKYGVPATLRKDCQYLVKDGINGRDLFACSYNVVWVVMSSK